MIISHVKIIAFQTIINHSLCAYFMLVEKTIVFIINRKIHGCLEMPDLFLVLNMIFVCICITRKKSYHFLLKLSRKW